MPRDDCKSPERGDATLRGIGPARDSETCSSATMRASNPCDYFFVLSCGIAATAVGSAFDVYGEYCELRRVPSFGFNWNPEIVLPRKFAV
jgi:hypothetical protein